MWTYFFVCLFLGYFGVHKFMEHKTGMGILYLCTFGLFGFGWMYDTVRYFYFAVTCKTPESKSKNNLPESIDELPIVIDTALILKEDERCHFAENAIRLITKDRVVGYSGGSAGVNLRLAKGVSFRTGTSKGAPVHGNVTESHNGRLFITNKRIIFSTASGGFDKKISDLAMLTPADDGFCLQFGTQSYLIELKNSALACRIINLLTKSN